jgi:hypothetical protein
MWVGRGVSIWVDNGGNLLQVLRGARMLFSSGINSEGNGRGGKAGMLLDGEACGMECEAGYQTGGKARLIRHIPSGVMKSVSK